jgi:hypothetical protein
LGCIIMMEALLLILKGKRLGNNFYSQYRPGI